MNVPKNVLVQTVSSPNARNHYSCFCVTLNSIEYVGKIHAGFGLWEPWNSAGESLGAFFDADSCLEFLLENFYQENPNQESRNRK